MSIYRAAIVILMLLSLSAPVRAQSPRYNATLTNNQLTVVDTQAHRTLVSPNSQTVLNSTSLPYTANIVSQPEGFDLVITITNPTGATKPLGCISLPGYRFGRVITAYNFRHAADRFTIDNHDTQYWGDGFRWPSATYSPVFVFGDSATTVGVSLLYDFSDYLHEAELQLTSPGGVYVRSGRNWELVMKLMGTLAPGQQHTYTVAVRFTDNQSDWLRTLAPYRDFFARTYGSVRYQRDARPICGYVIGDDPDRCPPGNPYCYGLGNADRPDLVGWGPMAAKFKAQEAKGYHRLMVWNPTGNFKVHKDLNFPFQFMTQMNAMPPARQTLDQLRSIPSPTFDMGYWWGNSCRVMRTWDPPTAENLDPANPDHVARAYAELDMAVGLGATTIGLDAFAYNGPVKAYPWLKMLRQRAPNVRFLVEGTYADIFHVLGPAWLYSDQATTSPILADFFVPGHETWAGVFNGDLNHRLHRVPTLADQRSEIARVTQLGYIAVGMDAEVLDRPYAAVESWRTTVPADLQAGTPSNSSPSTGTTGGSTGGGSPQPGVVGPPQTAAPGGGIGGGGAGGGGAAAGGGGGSGGLGFMNPSPSSLGGGGGTSVVTVTGSGSSGGATTTVTNPGGQRISSPAFSRAEIEAAIERAKPKALTDLSPQPIPPKPDAKSETKADPKPAKVPDPAPPKS
jgi:hypothetical protein